MSATFGPGFLPAELSLTAVAVGVVMFCRDVPPAGAVALLREACDRHGVRVEDLAWAVIEARNASPLSQLGL